MKILHLSDTHGNHRKLPPLPQADIIVHSGDMSWNGHEYQIKDFIQWFCDLDYQYKIFVAGNHDDSLYGEQIEGLPNNCHYLCNSGVEIEGLKFWGIPHFVYDDEKGRTPQLMAKIPAETDILVTHRPPFGILDTAGNAYYGCPDLLQAVLKIRPRYHLFGHIHAACGTEISKHTTFINSALVDENYELKNNPTIFEI